MHPILSMVISSVAGVVAGRALEKSYNRSKASNLLKAMIVNDLEKKPVAELSGKEAIYLLSTFPRSHKQVTFGNDPAAHHRWLALTTDCSQSKKCEEIRNVVLQSATKQTALQL